MDARELREVEVKLHTPDLAAVRRALQAADAKLVKERVFERNLRYDSADGELIAGGEVLRLRQDAAVKLTYKSDASVESGIVSRLEAEVIVSDFDTMHLILQRLGYRVALLYEKYRTTYRLGDAEIALDELPYGNFTEIEADAEEIERVVGKLGLGERRRMSESYVDIFAKLKVRLGLGFRDLSFAEFAGMETRDFFDLLTNL